MAQQAMNCLAEHCNEGSRPRCISGFGPGEISGRCSVEAHEFRPPIIYKQSSRRRLALASPSPPQSAQIRPILAMIWAFLGAGADQLWPDGGQVRPDMAGAGPARPQWAHVAPESAQTATASRCLAAPISSNADKSRLGSLWKSGSIEHVRPLMEVASKASEDDEGCRTPRNDYRCPIGPAMRIDYELASARC